MEFGHDDLKEFQTSKGFVWHLIVSMMNEVDQAIFAALDCKGP
jgi:hypothetical protein